MGAWAICYNKYWQARNLLISHNQLTSSLLKLHEERPIFSGKGALEYQAIMASQTLRALLSKFRAMKLSQNAWQSFVHKAGTVA